MWLRWEGGRVDLVSLAPARGTQVDHVLLPCDLTLLMQLGRISLGSSRGSLDAVRLTTEDGLSGSTDRRLVRCPQDPEHAVWTLGTVSTVADTLYE